MIPQWAVEWPRRMDVNEGAPTVIKGFLVLDLVSKV